WSDKEQPQRKKLKPDFLGNSVKQLLKETVHFGFFKFISSFATDVFHLFEHRLDNVGNTLVESFLHVKQEYLDA
ncbi:10362_t:CDS:1, partial [Gigaspora margarita]